MGKIAVLADNYYQVLELWYPYLRLKEAKFDAVLVGAEKKAYRSKEGYPVQVEQSIREVQAHDYAGVIVPGGYAPDILRRWEPINKFVKTLYQEGKLVAAICHGGWVLVSAGILQGKTVTGFYAIKDDLENAGAKYLDQEVVVDENLITSRNPQDLPNFCNAIIEFLNKFKEQ